MKLLVINFVICVTLVVDEVKDNYEVARDLTIELGEILNSEICKAKNDDH